VAISFPTSLDNFTNPSSGNTLDSPSHSLQHSDLNDAVEALERKVGVGTAVAGSASAGQVLTISAAGTSTWSTPTIPALVQIVPTSVAVGSGSGSVDANGAVTFSGASTVSINGVFNSTYQNYKVLIDLPTVTGTVNLRLRASGADNTTSNYKYSMSGATTFATATAYAFTSNADASWSYLSEAAPTAITMDIHNPNLAQNTFGNGLITQSDRARNYGAYFNATTVFDGFSLLVGTSMTGTIRVYGYKN
jgi:hypothetical protein